MKMRLSVEKGDPAYFAAGPQTYAAKVFLNGAPFKHAITADEERGFIFGCVPDARGRCAACVCGEEFMAGFFFGEVKIVLVN